MSIRILRGLGLGSLAISMFGCSVDTGEGVADASEALNRTLRELHVVAVTTSGGLRHTLRTDTTWPAFGDVEAQAGDIGTITTAETAESVGGLHVIAIAGGSLFHTIRTPNGGWSGFADMAGPLGNVGYHYTVGMAKGESETHVCTTTSSGLYHTIRNSDGSWTGWEDVIQKTGSNLVGHSFVGVDCAVTQVPASGCSPGQNCMGTELHLVGIMGWPTPYMYHAIRRSDGTWTTLNWVRDAALPWILTDVDVDTDVAGNLHVIATGWGDQVHAMRFPSGEWTPFGSIKGQAGDPGYPRQGAAVALDDGVYVFDQVDPGALFMTRRAENGAWDAFSNMTTAANSSETFSAVSVSGVPEYEVVR